MAELGKLQVRIDANMAPLVAQLAAAEKLTEKFGATSRKAGDMVEKSMAGARAETAKVAFSFMNLGSKAMAGLAASVAGIGLAGVITEARQTATEIANIGSEAKRAGVSARAFQELGYVAMQNRIPVDALTDGLKELSLRADELIQTGTGPAAESFHRLGYTAEELKEKLKNPSDLLVEIIGRMQGLNKAAQIRIADELFGGTAGERFVELVASGADGIRTLINEANDFGLVMDDQMIAKAAEIDRQFNLISQTVATTLKSAIINATSALSGFMDQFNQIERQQADTIRKSIELNFQDQAAAQEKLANLREEQASSPLPNLVEPMIRIQQGEVDKLKADYERMQKALDPKVLFKPGNDPKPASAPADTLNPLPFKSTTTTTKAGGKRAGATRDKAAEDAKREAEAIAELIGELEREQGLVGASDVEREISNALRRAGASATDEQKARISSLITQIDAETQAMERQKDAQEAMKAVASDVLHTIADGIRQGATAGEILGSVLDDLASKLVDMAINRLVENAFGGASGGGGGGGLLSGILGLFTGGGSDPWGGMRAAGGPVQSGKVYAVGEKGPELFAPGRSGTIIPNHAMQKAISIPTTIALPASASAGAAMSGGASNYVSSPTFNIDARGAQQGVAEEIEQRLNRKFKEYEKGEPARFLKARENAFKRTGR